MGKWLRRMRGAIGMGVTWALAWAVAGVMFAVVSLVLPRSVWEAFVTVFDAPAPALGVPGFVGGVLFSLVLGVAARRHRIEDLSVARVAGWGALGGLLLSLVPAAMVGVGLATIGTQSAGLWELTAIIAGPLALLSAVSAALTLTLAQRKEREVSAQSVS